MKFYVRIGQIKVVIDRPKPYDAAVAVIKGFGQGKLLDKRTIVNQTGFESSPIDLVFDTDVLLREIN